MLTKLMVAVVVSGAVLVPTLELMASENKRNNQRQRRLRVLLTKFARKKLEISGQIRSEGMRPMVGVIVYADTSSCSLALPLDAREERDSCNDERLVTVTDQNGQYRLQLRPKRKHKYLNVRFRIAQAGERTAVITLASVDYMLGRMPAGSYYRLDNQTQLKLSQEHRDLIYASRRVALNAEQLRFPWLQENRHAIARTLAHQLGKVIGSGEHRKSKQEVITVSSCGQHRWHRDEQHTTQQPLQLVDFRFLFPASGIDPAQLANTTSPECDTTTTNIDNIAL